VKFLQNIDTIRSKPHFEKGGRFEKLHPAISGPGDLPLRAGRNHCKHGVHVRDAMDLKRTMMTVIIRAGAHACCSACGMWDTSTTSPTGWKRR
jgi:Na+-transporting NADH:ubiquinone oxidoreductase subunit NqrB